MGSAFSPKAPKAKPSPYDAAMANIARETYESTAPLRQGLLGQYQSLLGGGFDVTQLPQYGAHQTLLDAQYQGARPGLEAQYDIAEQDIIGSMPRGGGMQGALGQLAQGRARAVADLGHQTEMSRQQMIMGLIDDMMQKAYGTAMGAPQTAISGYGPAAGNVAQRQLAQIQGTRSMADWISNPKGKAK